MVFEWRPGFFGLKKHRADFSFTIPLTAWLPSASFGLIVAISEPTGPGSRTFESLLCEVALTSCWSLVAGERWGVWVWPQSIIVSQVAHRTPEKKQGADWWQEIWAPEAQQVIHGCGPVSFISKTQHFSVNLIKKKKKRNNTSCFWCEQQTCSVAAWSIFHFKCSSCE